MNDKLLDLKEWVEDELGVYDTLPTYSDQYDETRKDVLEEVLGEINHILKRG